MKKLLLVLLILFLPLKVYGYTLPPEASNSIKVHDFAELLSVDEESELIIKLDQFIKDTNYDIVIVTINENPYAHPEKFAMDFYDYNKFGIDSVGSGVLILIDMDTRNITFNAVGNAILVYDDVNKKIITDLIASYATNEDYFGGLKEGITKTKELFDKGIPDSNKDYCINEEGDYYKCVRRTNWLYSGIIGGIVSLGIVYFHLRKYRGIRLKSDANDYMKSEVKGESSDTFKFTATTRVRMSSDSSSGGRGGGGSSIGRSSSGRSHSSSSSRF